MLIISSLQTFKMRNVLFAALLSVCTSAYSQKEDDPRYELHYVAIPVIETPEVTIEIIRPHSQESFTQFTAKITNKTDDYILIKKHEVTFTAENGYGEKRPKEDIDFIEPRGEITRTIKVEGGIGFKQTEIKLAFNGFSRASAVGEMTEGGMFTMKPQQNSLMMGPFAITLKKWTYNPKEMTTDFKVRYRGEGMGLVYEDRIKLMRMDGTVLINEEAKAKPFIIGPMATRTVNVVKQFEKGLIGKDETIKVVWDDALLESKGTPFQVPGFVLIADMEKTKLENK